MQPVIYDRTVSNINPKQAIFALSLVMVMNYVAIVTYPFLLRLLENMFHSDSAYFPFFLCMILSVAFTIFVFFRSAHRNIRVKIISVNPTGLHLPDYESLRITFPEVVS